jgi:Domain of unknown function (DUF5666)
MKIRLVSTLALSFALGTLAYAQDAPAAPQQNQAQNPNPGTGAGGGWGQRGGRGMGMGMGRGVQGTVTEVAADHYTVKTFTGEMYIIHYSANTRVMKQAAGMRGGRGQGQGGNGSGNGEGGGQGWRGGNPPQQIKASDIKVGDAIAAMGEVDANAKSVGAVAVVLMDPERAKAMEQMEADYGKTWLMGKVTAIDGVKVTLSGGPDNASHSFVADENTTFRKRRDPITLGDIQVGDMVRADGAVKNGAFTATAVSVMGGQGETRVPRDGQAPAENPPAPQ